MNVKRRAVALAPRRIHTHRVKLAWLALLAVPAVALAAACADQPIGDPAGSNNYDDPDDPGHPGISSGGPDASGDAYGKPCTAPRDCPAAFTCAYSIASACGAAGECLPYDGGAACDAAVACGCDQTDVVLCAPEGYAPKPVASASACGAPAGAGTDDAADAGDQ